MGQYHFKLLVISVQHDRNLQADSKVLTIRKDRLVDDDYLPITLQRKKSLKLYVFKMKLDFPKLKYSFEGVFSAANNKRMLDQRFRTWIKETRDLETETTSGPKCGEDEDGGDEDTQKCSCRIHNRTKSRHDFGPTENTC